MEENDLKEIFSPFGEVINLQLCRDEITRINKGYAFIEYKTPKQANDAMTSMNLFELCNKQLRIGKAIAPPFDLGGAKKVNIPKLRPIGVRVRYFLYFDPPTLLQPKLCFVFLFDETLLRAKLYFDQ